MEYEIEYEIVKLDKELAEVERKLNKLVENGEEYDKVYNQSVVTDKVIIRYLDAKKKLEDEQKKMIKKYQDKLETSYKEEIINQIKTDVKKEYPTINDIELNHFSNNVYVYSTLTAYEVNEQEIIDQLVYLNNRFIELSNGDYLKDNSVKLDNINFLKELNEKYVKIIKSRI